MESRSVRRRELVRGTRRPSSDLWTWGTLVILLLLSLCKLSQECPSVCECKWKSGKESVLCSKGRLRAIPNGLDPGTQVLDMSNNMMEKLPSRIFLSLNLLNLQKIFLSECQLVSLEKDSFVKLSNLIELDLSGNRLESIPSHTFPSIPELRELKVSSNPISRLSNDAFVALPRLVRLELTACRLRTIETGAFRGLPDLEWLHLDNNRLLTVQAESFYPLRSLHGLEVAGNPWNCSCVLQPLREWMRKHNVPFSIPPTCSTPKEIEGKSWDRLQLEDFACLPKFTSSTEQERISSVVEGENGTLLCRLRATPDTQVRWLSGNKGSMVVANGSVGATSAFVLTESFVRTSSSLSSSEETPPSAPLSSLSSSSEEGLSSGDRSLGIKISKLTVIRTTPREAGIYVCRAESKAGIVWANFTLLVLQTRAEGLTGRLLFTGAVVVALLTLVVCLLLLCVVLGSRRVRSTSHVLTEAEKIELNHLDNEYNRQNGGGTVPLIGDNNGDEENGVGMNHVHVHSHSNNTGHGGGGGGIGGGLSYSLNNVIVLRKGGGGGGSSGASREYNDYKALPTADPDDNDRDRDRDKDNCPAARGGGGSDDASPFHVPNLNVKRHSVPPPVQSPPSQLLVRTTPDHHSAASKKDTHNFVPERGGYHHQQRDVFPDLLREKLPTTISTTSSDFTSLPRPNRNHDPPKPGNYFHRRINSESQSPLLSNSFGMSMERVGRGFGGSGGSETHFGGPEPSSLTMSTGGGSGGGSSEQMLSRQAQQRLSMPTSPTHERDVLSYDYHAAQLASFLEEYRLLQLELMRMSASLNHVDQPPNNVNSSPLSSAATRLPRDSKPPHVPPRQLPPNPNFLQESPRTQLAQLHQRQLLQQRRESGSSSSNNGSGGSHHQHSHHHQLKSILKNPTASNNNYMA